MEYYLESYQVWRQAAPDEFQRAYLKGWLDTFVRRITRQPCHLQLFETVKTELNLVSHVDRGLQDIRLDRITGSVSKAECFTSGIMPASRRLEDRWNNMYALMQGANGYPPIKVYQVGEDYYIFDGHHRASVARYLGNWTIEAYVTEWLIQI